MPTMRTIGISISPGLLERLDLARGGLPRSRVISQLVREFVEKREAIQEEGA